MKISLVDDIAGERDELSDCLHKWSEEKNVNIDIAEYQSGRDFIKSCSKSIPDMVFMDIYIGEENGMDIVAELRKITTSCVTVFITSSKADALDAFPLHPFDYVVKPYSNETIFRVMNEVAELLEINEKHLEVTAGRKTIRLPMSQILYATSDAHHVSIVMNKGENIKIYSTFSEISDNLLCDGRFLVCNRGIIVNMDYIVESGKKCFVMKNGDSLPLKIKEISTLEKAFTEYIFSRAKKW